VEEGRDRLRGPDRLRVLQRIEGNVERAVELGLFSDGLREFGLDGGAFAAGEVTAPQFGPQLLDVVVKRDHRPLLFRD